MGGTAGYCKVGHSSAICRGHDRHTMKRSTLPILALLAALVLPAMPAAASPEQASALRAALIQQLTRSAENRTGLHVERVPDLQVTDEGRTYRVRIPKLRVAAGTGWMVEAPLLEGQGEPQVDGSWRIRATLPQPLGLYGGNGFRLGDITLDRQDLSLVVSGDGYRLLAADINLAGARFTPAMGAGTGRLSALRLVLTPKAWKGESWSGRLSLLVDGLSVKDPAGVDRLTVGHLRLDGGADGLDMRRMATLLSTGDRAALDRIARNLDLTADLTGFRFVADDGTRTALSKGQGKLTLAGLAAAKAGLTLDWKHEGLEGGGPGAAANLWPARADIAVTGQSLPRALLSSPPPPGGWTPVMAAAGSSVRATRLNLWTPQSTVIGQADMRFTPKSPEGVTGDANLSLRGIDRMIAGINQAMGVRGAGIGIALYALQGLGRLQAGPEGTTHQYNLSIAPEGTVTLNGTDATSLFKGLMAVN